jgi:hypothetical protein
MVILQSDMVTKNGHFFKQPFHEIPAGIDNLILSAQVYPVKAR